MKSKRNKQSSLMTIDDADTVKVKITRKEYEKELRKLQAELCALQDWVVSTGKRIIIVFEVSAPPGIGDSTMFGDVCTASGGSRYLSMQS